VRQVGQLPRTLVTWFNQDNETYTL